jgi:hypothetical protein
VDSCAFTHDRAKLANGEGYSNHLDPSLHVSFIQTSFYILPHLLVSSLPNCRLICDLLAQHALALNNSLPLGSECSGRGFVYAHRAFYGKGTLD